MQQSDRPGSPQAPREITAEEKAELRLGTTIKRWIDSDGWRVYKQILEAHIANKRKELEAPAEANLDGVAQALRFEATKGSILGLRLALTIPEGIIANDKMLRQALGLAAGEPEDDE